MQRIDWDRNLIEELYEECYPKIASWIKKNSGSQAEAEDVFQDAMIAVYQKTRKPEFALSSKLSTFVFGVAKNIWLDKLRKKRRFLHTDFTESSDIQVDDKIISELLVEYEMEKIYERAFKKLNEECQEILSYFFNRISMKEIVVKMGLNSNEIARKRKFNCKNKLIEYVKKDPLYEELVIQK